MDRVDPIRAYPRETTLSAVARVADGRVRRETPEEAAERRRREQEERQRRQARRAWAEAQKRRIEEQAALQNAAQDEPGDGHAHVDIRA